MSHSADLRLGGMVVLWALSGCSADGSPSPVQGDGRFDEATWAALLTLTADELPPPPGDASNRVADDARAAAWGQRLFFDAGFSGTLLDSDNDGMHGGVGLQGETGKVSCASCHVPEDGFSDTRTVFQQISLAAGWTPRRTPSILDVGQAKLLMWDPSQ
jgi:cytochrome c peroxidase